MDAKTLFVAACFVQRAKPLLATHACCDQRCECALAGAHGPHKHKARWLRRQLGRWHAEVIRGLLLREQLLFLLARAPKACHQAGLCVSLRCAAHTSPHTANTHTHAHALAARTVAPTKKGKSCGGDKKKTSHSAARACEKVHLSQFAPPPAPRPKVPHRTRTHHLRQDSK